MYEFYSLIDQVEIKASDPTKCRIWQNGYHPEANEGALEWSRRLRTLVIADAIRGGVTPGIARKREYANG